MEFLLILLAMLILLVLKGFFSGSEIALVNADKLKLNHKAKQGDRGAAMVLESFKSPEQLLGTTLVGTNIATMTLTAIGTVLMIEWFGANGELVAFLVFTPLFLVFGEVVPKSVFQQTSDVVSTKVIFPLRIFAVIFHPIIFVFSRVARFAARLTGASPGGQNMFMTREQIRAVVEMAERGANVDPFDRSRIRRVIRFGDTTVGEAMIPVAEITAINYNRSLRKAVVTVRRKGYNRLPVYRRNISNVVGILTLSTWDLMDKDLTSRSLTDLVKPALYVSPHQTIDDLLPVLRQRDDHMAIVVDEFGSAVGMITMEDIIEEVVGEIDVGYDFEEYLPKRKRVLESLDDEAFLMDSRMPISEANDVLDINLPATEFHTVGGLVTARLRHIPTEGESVTEEGYRFTVEKANDRAVLKLRVEPELAVRRE